MKASGNQDQHHHKIASAPAFLQTAGLATSEAKAQQGGGREPSALGAWFAELRQGGFHRWPLAGAGAPLGLFFCC